MMSERDMEELVAALVARGLATDVAQDYAVWIGDTPEVDTDGLWVVRNDAGVVVDRIRPVEGGE